MFNLNQLQRLPVKLTLSALLLLEVAVIAANYALPFPTFFTLISLLLSLPIAYFGFHYIRTTHRFGHPAVHTYESVSNREDASSQYSNAQIDKLTSSQEYKDYRRKLQQKGGLRQKTNSSLLQNQEPLLSEQRLKEQEMERMLEQFQEKQTQIFDD